MSPLDLLILLALASAVVGGYRLGFLARITSWAGLALGVFLGAVFLPEVAKYFEDADPGVRAVAAVAFLLASGMLGQGIGLALGAALHASLRVGPGFRQYDRLMGAIGGALGILVIFWMLGPSLTRMRGTASEWAKGSVILEMVGSLAPKPPDPFFELSRILGTEFPQVFENPFDESQDAGVPPAEAGIPPEVHAVVAASTVKIEGQACRKIQEGSGFVAGPDLVVTNAHVVAGEDATTVQRNDGEELQAVVVMFDPDRDLAVLRVPGMGRNPLPVARAEDGQQGAVYGHPGGGPLEVSPARVSQRVTAVGRDIYDRNRTRRDVFILASNLQPGDSGGPFVDQAGQVVGVAFAIAPDRSNTAYALTEQELQPALAAVQPDPVETGPCLV